MQFSGYIEGYYGRLFSWEQRRAMISHCASLSLNSYLFAPKEDYYHRVGWRETPPHSYKEELQQSIKLAKSEGVCFIPAIAPGLSYDFASLIDRKALFNRISEFIEAGATRIALLMDDIPLELPENVVNTYENLADAQLELLSLICEKYSVDILFCPTVYTNQLLDSDEASIYLQKLAQDLPKEVYLFWTGPHTIAQEINEKSCGKVSNLYPGKVIFWDNYYSNDYCPTRLFVGPYIGRDRQFISETAGIMINPTGHFHTDKLLLQIFNAWKTGAPITDESWITLAETFGIPQEYAKLLPWFHSPYTPAKAEALLEISDNPIDFFTDFIVQWHGEMKIEWYPYLHNLFTEIKLLTGKTITDREWYTLRFPPALAERLHKANC